MNADVLEEGRAAAADYVEGQAARLIERGIPTTGHVVTDGEPAAGILHFAEESGAGLIAMCTHGRSGVSRLVLGSVTDKVHSGRSDPDFGRSSSGRVTRISATNEWPKCRQWDPQQTGPGRRDEKMGTVREIMRTEVVTGVPDMSVYDLSKLLADMEISGAPVVDVDGEVLGVVSMTDVIRLAGSGADIRVAPRPLVAEAFSIEEPLEDEYEEEQDVVDYFRNALASPVTPRPSGGEAAGIDLDQYVVREIMTPANFHMHPDSDLREAAAFLLRGRIHRALVMEDDRLVGIVTTVDRLRTMAEPT